MWHRYLFSIVALLMLRSQLVCAASPETFPPTKSSTTGALLIVGGGDDLEPLYDAFFALAGGREARIAYIPTATETFEADVDDPREFRVWRERASSSFTFVHTRDRSTAEAKSFAEPIQRATGVWIGGGSQARLTEIYGDTPVMSALHALVARGGVVAGNSAGAAIMSQMMIADQHERGLVAGYGFALCPATVVDSHFTQRRREPRLLRMLNQFPDHSGIGIDEDTALLIRNQRVLTLGKGTVTLFARQPDKSEVQRIVLRANMSYDLQNLTANPQSAKVVVKQYTK